MTDCPAQKLQTLKIFCSWRQKRGMKFSGLMKNGGSKWKPLHMRSYTLL